MKDCLGRTSNRERHYVAPTPSYRVTLNALCLIGSTLSYPIPLITLMQGPWGSLCELVSPLFALLTCIQEPATILHSLHQPFSLVTKSSWQTRMRTATSILRLDRHTRQHSLMLTSSESVYRSNIDSQETLAHGRNACVPSSNASSALSHSRTSTCTTHQTNISVSTMITFSTRSSEVVAGVAAGASRIICCLLTC